MIKPSIWENMLRLSNSKFWISIRLLSWGWFCSIISRLSQVISPLCALVLAGYLFEVGVFWLGTSKGGTKNGDIRIHRGWSQLWQWYWVMLINHWFLSMRPAMKPLFLGRVHKWGVGWPAWLKPNTKSDRCPDGGGEKEEGSWLRTPGFVRKP